METQVGSEPSRDFESSTSAKQCPVFSKACSREVKNLRKKLVRWTLALESRGFTTNSNVWSMQLAIGGRIPRLGACPQGKHASVDEFAFEPLKG
eukprot:scaffold38610_cov14-Tisochrysis_lutea.AAC.1